ncbi:Sucrose phosphorylase [Pontiella desulfatans]|uniref:Sucrose phosphorylase n=1 Tax=Pontiella desulfatans TaxID=2750659 RepID=A0A6C2TYG9_PONDE|nr:sugar phosphorylase [Pontiella desulfatans]VGO12730.1 Sucrose phosphorylase [Pontiella desulfatans]
MIKNLDIHAIERMRKRFNRLYGPGEVEHLLERMVALIGRYGVGLEGYSEAPLWDETSSVLITYGDMVQQEGEAPLAVLKRFADQYLGGAIDTVHILPFCPYSSDDGFSVINYRVVDPDLGSWKDVQELGHGFRLMYDLVLNHCSRKSKWFADYVADIAPFRDFFIEADPENDLSGVTRPRALPLLTPVQTRHGDTHVWTTFSDDQMDLNFANPDVLFEFLDILLFYISTGATIIRLDAIAYLWKQIGTSCIHLKQTHEVVKLMRDLLDMVAPDVVLLTETNVPHEENISYFGKGDEAHMVYQFSLPPLLLHGLMNGDATYLTNWAASLNELPEKCTYFNFTASHDGIGVRPLQGIVPNEELMKLADRVKSLGGHVSTKANPDGSESPYELNITYFDALGDHPESVTDAHMARFLCSQTVAMELRGVPAVYFHSLTGTRNNYAGVEETGRARTINRLKWNEGELENVLSDPHSHPARIMKEYVRRLQCRAQHKVFHPDAAQNIINLGSEWFAVEREWKEQRIICISNFTDQYRELKVDDRLYRLNRAAACSDLLSGRRYMGDGKVIPFDAYQTVWLQL